MNYLQKIAILLMSLPFFSVYAFPIQEHIKSCDSGNGTSCYLLGRSYSNGSDVKQDDLKANSYFIKACNAGNGDGCNEIGGSYALGVGAQGKRMITK